MDDVSDSEARRRELIELFLRRTRADVEGMRRDVPRLIGGDDASWRDLRFNAQLIGGTAAGLGLGVLSACARELHQLAEERFVRSEVDAQFLLSVTSAIEMVAIELAELARDGGTR